MIGMVIYLLRSLYPPQRRRRWRGYAVGILVAVLLVGTAGYAAGWIDTKPVVKLAPGQLDRMMKRVDRARMLYDGAEAYIGENVAPLDAALRRYRDKPVLTRRIAVSVVRQSNRLRIDPQLLLGVLLVENPELNPTARSRVGARGLMQVMPQHRGAWPCGPVLVDVEANICYGAHIFANNLQEVGGDVRKALLRYNGCVKGTNTPDCHEYPSQVIRRARWVSGQTRSRTAAVTAE